MKNSDYVIDQFIADYLKQVISATFEDKSYCPDYEVVVDNGRVHVARHDKTLVDDLDTVVAFLNSDFEDSSDFEAFKVSPASKLGQLGGAARTKAKSKASRANGKLGGRPRANR